MFNFFDKALARLEGSIEFHLLLVLSNDYFFVFGGMLPALRYIFEEIDAFDFAKLLEMLDDLFLCQILQSSCCFVHEN